MSDSTKALALLPSDSEWSKLKEIGLSAFKSGLIPTAIKTPEAATIIALKSYELGLPPMVGFAHINVINGKPSCSAELMLASIRTDHHGAVIQFVEMTEKKCVIKAKRKEDADFTMFSMTFDEAEQAGFAKQWNREKNQWEIKDNWKKQPKTMLKWRVVSEMKRTLFPEILMGLDHTPEELERDVTPPSLTAPTPPNHPGGGEVVIQSFGQSDELASDEKQAVQTEAAAPAPLKNYAPQTAQDAKNWKPGDSDPRKDQPPDPTPEQPKTPDKRAIVSKEIGQLAAKLKLTTTQMKAQAKKFFGKEEAQQLTTQELELLRDILKNEVENANANQ